MGIEAGELLALGRRAEGLDPEWFGFDPELENDVERATSLDDALKLMGCFWHAAVIVVNELLIDLCQFTAASQNTESAQVADLVDDLEGGVLAALPPRWHHKFTIGFAQRFAVSMSVLSARITGEWVAPMCVAEQLGVRVLLDQTELVAEMAGLLLPEDWRDWVEASLLEDLDMEWLYDPDLDGIEEDGAAPRELGLVPMAFDCWFRPIRDEAGLSPFTLD